MLNLILSFICFTSFCFATPELTVVTMAIGKEYQSIVKPGIKNKKRYCRKYGYDFVCEYNSLNADRPPPWSKIPAILNAMEDPNVKWVFWTDADSLIMNFQVNLQSFIDEDYDIIIANGFNSGQFFIRNCEWSKNLLRDVYNRTEFINHHLWENIALVVELEEKPYLLERIKQVLPRVFNSFPLETCETYPNLIDTKYEPGDFILHFASHRGEDLRNMFKKYKIFIQN